MDLGPQWPFLLLEALALVGVIALTRLAWLHAAGAATRSRAALWTGAWGCLAIALWFSMDGICRAGGTLGMSLPGCNWEYEPAPAGRQLILWIPTGALFTALRLGVPVALLASALAALRWNRRANSPLPRGLQEKGRG